MKYSGKDHFYFKEYQIEYFLKNKYKRRKNRFVNIQSMMKSFIHPSILYTFIYFSESNSCMMPSFYMLKSTKKEYKTQFSGQ